MGIICPVCHKDKDESEYYFKNKKTGELAYRCKQCQNEYSKQHYNKNKKIYIDKSRKRRHFNVNAIFEYKKDKACTDCGGIFHPDAMQFDHVNGYKIKDVCKLCQNDTWERVLGEIAKCEIVCANCHSIRTWKRTHQGDEMNVDPKVIENEGVSLE